MKNLAVVLAKGESKRCHRKNFADICGKPALAYPIEICKKANCDDVIVSTDSEEIRDIAFEYGADDVLMRNSNWIDAWNFNDTLEGTIKEYEEKTGKIFDDCTQTGGTALFLRPSWIRVAIRLLRTMVINTSRVQYVDTADINGVCKVYRIARHGVFYSHTLKMAHFGINVDIDYPEDLELAKAIMEKIKDGSIPYSLDENIHEDAHRIETSLAKGATGRH